MRKNRIESLLVVFLLMCLLVALVPSGEASSPSTSYSDYSEIGHVSAILPVADFLWVGAQAGELVRLNPATDEEQRFAYPIPGVPVRDLARDSRGNIWVATGGGGLGRFDGQSWVTYTPDNSPFPSLDVRTVLVDEVERVWAGTGAGVAYLEEGNWTVYNTQNSGLVSDDVTALVVKPGAVWCGTGMGLSNLSPGQWGSQEWITYQTTNSLLPHNHITALAPDRQGNLWVGTEVGIVRMSFMADWWTNPVVKGTVYDILIDSSNTPWLNLGQFVGHLTECSWSTFDTSLIGLKATSISAVALDAKDRLWAGAEGGLAMLEPSGARGTWLATDVKQPVHALALQGSDLWLEPDGTAVRYNTATGESAMYLPEYGLGAEIRDIAVDESGWVWFTTWGAGLTFFNGSGWDVYMSQNVPLPSDYISSAAAAPGGGTLFGTSKGLILRQNGNWRPFSSDEPAIKSGQITAVAVSADGRVAAGIHGGGVALLDGGRWTVFDTSNSAIPGDYIQSLAFDAAGSLWVGAQGDGVGHFDGVDWTAYRSGPGGPGGDFVYALLPDAKGNLWVGTEDGGLSVFDGCLWTVYDMPDSEDGPLSVYDLAMDASGKLWLGTDQGLLAFVPPVPYPSESPPSPMRPLDETPVPATEAVRSVAQAASDTDQWITHGMGKSVHNIAFADDVLWAATMHGGAVQWDVSSGRFRRFLYPQDGIGGNQVVYIAVDPIGRIWCATHERGVSVYDGLKWTIYDTSNSGLAHNTVNGIVFGPYGQIWFATLGGGVSMFDGQNWTVYTTQNSGLVSDFVWYVAVDSLGRLWCGTMSGLSVFDGQTWYTYPGTSNVHCVAFDSQGRTWFGDGMGLNLVEGQTTVEVSRNLPGVYTKDVYAIAFDAEDNAWLGTANGVFRFDGQNMVLFDAKTTGLRGHQVFAVAIGPDGRVWFGGDEEDGIASFDGSVWRNYSTASGPNPASEAVISSCVDTQGRVWLGTDRGVSVYDGTTWIGYTINNSGLLANRVEVIAQEPATGQMWFGTPAGVSIFDPPLPRGAGGANGARWTSLTPDNSGLLDPEVLAILFDSQRGVWIGSRKGASLFDGQAWLTFTPDDSPLPADGVRSLALDNQGRIWMGLSWLMEVAVFDGQQWTIVTPEQYGMQDQFGSVSVTTDLQGQVWLAAGPGLAVFDGSKWTTYLFADMGLENQSVSDLVFDPAGRLWLGIYDGVLRIEKGAVVSYTPDNSPLVGENTSSLSVDTQGHVWIGVAEAGASELIPAANRFPMPPTPTPVPTWTPYVSPATLSPPTPPWTPTPLPPATPTPVPRAAPQATGLEPTGIFAAAWNQLGGGNGALGWALAPERQIFCADQRLERGYMFWRNNDPVQGTVYVLTYRVEGQDSGDWWSFPDTWDQSQPQSGGYSPPAGLYEPVRGFGKVWQGLLGSDPPPPPIGWAVESEQGSDAAQYQDFQSGVMLYSPRLNRIMALVSDGTWRAFPAQ